MTQITRKTGTYFFLFMRVREQQAIIIERFGKFNRQLQPGLRFIFPFIDQIAYTHLLKEQVYQISSQAAITKDNVELIIDGVLYLQIVDAQKASYGVADAIDAIQQLAQTTMRSELGKLKLDDTFRGREELNHAIVTAINDSASNWGIACMRYEIRDITIPATLRKAMERQAETERQKRAEILKTQGQRQADINIAEGIRQASILKAEGEAKAIQLKAEADCKSIDLLSKSIKHENGIDAVRFRIAEKYLKAFMHYGKSENTMVVSTCPNEISEVVGKSYSVFDDIKKFS